MSVREQHSFTGQTIETWCRYLRAFVVATKITVTKIVSEDVNDVGFAGRLGRVGVQQRLRREQQGDEEEDGSSIHTIGYLICVTLGHAILARSNSRFAHAIAHL